MTAFFVSEFSVIPFFIMISVRIRSRFANIANNRLDIILFTT